MSIAPDLIERSLKHIWYPCSQMKDYETFAPLEVIGASGCDLKLKDGRLILDAISSWWCKSLGHAHPRLKKALKEQLEKFEHVILANTTNETIVNLSEKLSRLMPALNKVFYASDGSCAVEIAMKMSLHARVNEAKSQRQVFLALENAFHGETVGALSVSDIGIYRDAYAPILFPTHFISPLPYVSGMQDPLWHDCEAHWQRIEKKLEPYAECATAILVEPIVQGAGGMKIYSPDFLKRLYAWAKTHDIHFIADEIMTGMGRTGKMLACEYANIEPDFICLSKGLTSGCLPLSVVLTRQSIYDVFYDDYAAQKSFLHSHTYSGNALAASVAMEVLNIMEEENIVERANQIGHIMLNNLLEIEAQTKKITNVRAIGAIAAADLICDDANRRLGYEVYQQAVKRGVLLRCLGNTIYWLPPLTIEMDRLDQLKQVTQQALLAV